MADTGSDEDRRAARRQWPVRIVHLTDAPTDDLSAQTTAEERLAMMWPLAVEAWALTGRPLPTYPRHEAPVEFRPAGRRGR